MWEVRMMGHSNGGQKDSVVHRFPDGHEIAYDRYQWIVHHPSGCAQRYSRRSTFSITTAGLAHDLSLCGIKEVPDAVKKGLPRS